MITFAEWLGGRTLTVDWYSWEENEFYCVLLMSDGNAIHVDGDIVALVTPADEEYQPIDEILGLDPYARIVWDASTKPFTEGLEKTCRNKLPTQVALPYGWVGVYDYDSRSAACVVNEHGDSKWSVGMTLKNDKGGVITGWFDGARDKFYDLMGCCTLDLEVSHPCPRCGAIVPHTLTSELRKHNRFNPEWVGFTPTLDELEKVVP